MAILHGSWIIKASDQAEGGAPSRSLALSDGYFFVWGEIWRRVDPIGAEVAPHPYAMNQTELITLLRSLRQSGQIQWAIAEVPLEEPVPARGRRKSTASEMPSPRWKTVTLSVPTYPFEHPEGSNGQLPQHSAAVTAQEPDAVSTVQLHPWAVSGIWLTPLEAIQLLNSLPLSSVSAEETFMGSDLRFWSHVARWNLDLLARRKFVPGLALDPDGAAHAYWQTLVDSGIDQVRLEQFSRQMPPACRAYGDGQANLSEPHRLLFSFLNQATDAQVRAIAAPQTVSPTLTSKEIPLKEWLQALGKGDTITAAAGKLDRLNGIIQNWLAPLERQLQRQTVSFRTCLVLNPPKPGTTLNWQLDYCLQAIDDPEFLVSADVIWDNPVERLPYRGRTIERPQETLLAGLGLASRLYPLIEPSLGVAEPLSSPLTPTQVYEFLRGMAWKLQDSGLGVVLPPSLANQDGWANRLGLSIRAETPKGGKKQRLGLQSLLNFKWELTIGGQRISKPEFDRLVALNTPLVEINGEWVELRPQDIRSAQAFFDNRKDQRSLSLEDALRISTGDTQIIDKLPVLSFEASGALQELINTLTTGNQTIEAIAIPKSFRGELRPYQERGAAWMAFLERWGLGACLADDMGLGKTIQFIALMLYLKEQDTLDTPTLLVCPTSVLGNWEREIKKFGPSLKVLVHHGEKRLQGKAFLTTVKDKHLVLTSYALVYRDEKDLKAVEWQGIVLDEAQNIKNAESRQSQAVRQLDSQFRIALTGTPVENRLTELWSIMDFLNPGYLGPRNFFQRRFAIPIERYGDTDSLKTLRSLVQPFILRRLKTDRSIIQDLPEKQEMTVFCGLSAEQATMYQALVDQSLVQIESAEGIQRRGMILGLLVKLKQICNHPELFKAGDEADDKATVPEGTLATFQQGSGKLQRLTEMLEELLAEGDRCLIFTQFATWGKALKPFLEQQFGREVLFLYGGSSKKQREEMVDRFQNDPQGPRVFILSLKAGGVGLNLTRANHVFHFDRWWNPAVENQATDRVFRIGQTRNVQVHKFVCTGTLEERIHELIESKKALSEQVVGAGENWLTDLDADQLRNLLLLDRAAVIDESGG